MVMFSNPRASRTGDGREETVQKCVVYKKITKRQRNSVFRETVSPEMTSQSFPVSCFRSRCFVPHPESEFQVFGTSKHGEEKSLSYICFSLYLSTH